MRQTAFRHLTLSLGAQKCSFRRSGNPTDPYPNTGPGKGQVKPGDRGTYGDLNTQKRNHGETESLDTDHRPSYAAQKKALEDA